VNTKRAFKLFGIVFLALADLAFLLGAASAQEGDDPQAPQVALGGGFTYQGYIERDGAPVSGACDLQFALYDDPSAGLQVGVTQTVLDAAVSGGRFTVVLNQGGEFGPNAFDGEARWLSVSVRCPAGGGQYGLLSPRQPLNAAPYALGLRPGAVIGGEVSGDGALNLANSASNGNGLNVYSAGGYGVVVDSAGLSGVHVGSAGGDGLFVCTAGDVIGCTPSGFNSGLEVSSAEHDGVHVGSAGLDGLYVGSAGGSGMRVLSTNYDGMAVNSAGQYGVHVGFAGEDGLFVCRAGNVASCTPSSFNNGLEVGHAEHDGVHVVSADDFGVYVGSVYDGVRVTSAVRSGLWVNSAGEDGVIVSSAGEDGVIVSSAGQDGVIVYSAGWDGVVVGSAGSIGVYANTTDAAGEWGFYTPDKIRGSNVTAASFSLVAQVAPGTALEPGQVVAAVGLGAPLPMSPQAVPLVALAQDPSAGLAGVVEGRLVAELKTDEEGNERVDLHSDPGTAGPGDYVLLTIAGVAYVRVAPEAAITPGMRLAVSDGLARSLQTREIDGMLVSEGAPTLGTALEANSPDNPLIAVFVSLR
jgi:hypothetical protein